MAFDVPLIIDLQMHVFFLSTDRVLSEYRYSSPTGWRGGDACLWCITHSGFQVAEGSDVLYALESPTDNTIRVGCQSWIPGHSD